MSALLEKVRAETFLLPTEEKLLLGVELIDSACLADDPAESRESVSEAWDAEIRRRVEDIRSGKVKTVPWDVVLAQANARFGWDK